MHNSEESVEALKQLAGYLNAQRESILTSWRRAVDADPELMTASTTTRAQFIDHIPAVLDAFERRLSAEDPSNRELAREEQRDSAAEHGLHRWQQGYNQPETMCEWGHLHLCLLQALETYATDNSGLEFAVMQIARRELVQLCSDGVCASATRYTLLHHVSGDLSAPLSRAARQLGFSDHSRLYRTRREARKNNGRGEGIWRVNAEPWRVLVRHRTSSILQERSVLVSCRAGEEKSGVSAGIKGL